MNSWVWNPPPRSEWRRIGLESVVIVMLGILVGFSVNVDHLRRVFAGERIETESTASLAQVVPVSLEEARDHLAAGALAIDARLPEEFSEGHLPGAYNLPLAEIEEMFEAFTAETDKGRELLVYCSGYGCPDSQLLAERLLQQGYRQVLVYEGGFPEWRDAGLPVGGGGR